MGLSFRKSAAFLILSSLLALPACGSSSKSPSPASSGSSAAGGSGGSGGSATVKCQEPPQLDVGGVWAAKVRMTVNLVAKPGGAITLCPGNQNAQATLYMYLDMKQNASDPKKLDSIAPHVCSVELPVVSGLAGTCNPSSAGLVNVQLQIPPTLEQAFPTISLPSVSGALGGTAPGASFSAQKVMFVAGTTEQGASMPSWNTSDQACSNPQAGRTSQCDATCVSDCGKLRDDDGDGYPGVTLAVCGLTKDDAQQKITCNTTDPSQTAATIQGRVWIDLQIDPAFTGKVNSSCDITGHVDASILYNLVGGNVWLTGTPLAVSSAIGSLPTFKVISSASAYRLLRVDGRHGAPNWKLGSDPVRACQAVLQHRNDL